MSARWRFCCSPPRFHRRLVPNRPNVLLIVLDTLRYDATTRNNMPFLASLVSRGVVFTNAYSTHDFTPPSHFSMVTGLRDGLGSDDDRLENGVPYQLQRAGYDTFATAANVLISTRQMPTFRGFSDFKEPGDINSGTVVDAVEDMTEIDLQLAMLNCRPTPHARTMVYFSADRLLPMFLEQIRHARPPYFGFVNLVDTHEPYIPDPNVYAPERNLPPGFNGDIVGRRLSPELSNPDSIADPARRTFVKSKIAQAGAASLTSIDLSPVALTIYHRRYDELAREADESLREFFDAAQRDGLLNNTIVIITSDHGESFGEAGLVTHMFHDRGDYESTHHVPMLFVLPSSLHSTTRLVDRRVSIASLAPTIYDMAGLNWSAFKTHYPSYARSLFPLFAEALPKYTASVFVPKPAKQDLSEAEQERQKALRTLGYVH
ncbi:MAG: hypothetical protein DMF58_01935 [Acidobacteria bacterium]|nr:MAG: hypothetical protein DMF58_01935 [Acidobacteriota bacterium]